ncbi:MAG: YceI family protein [Bacteroidota bacterium]
MTHEIKWSVDRSHTTVTFEVTHLMIAAVKGSFKVFDASIYTTGKDFSTAKSDFWIESASIDTGTGARDAHLKGPDFLDSGQYPQIHFISESVTSSGVDCNHMLAGKLTIKGITKNVSLNLAFGGIQNDHQGNQKAGFSLTGTIKRSDWGIVWNQPLDTGGLLVGDEITISCEIVLVKADQFAQTMIVGG